MKRINATLTFFILNLYPLINLYPQEERKSLLKAIIQ